jgi:uncharacterized membrane protein YbhN (UPF0104 family)
MWAVIEALPTAPPWQTSLADLPLWIASSALALVAGFVSLVPGGAGVRELVITESFAGDPLYGPVFGLSVAVLLRLAWLQSELAASAILYPFAAHFRRAAGHKEAAP